MKAFPAIAFQRDERITEHLVDQSVHRRFFKFASIARLAAELCGALNLFCQEV